MMYEQHSGLVSEVIGFIRSGPLLRPTSSNLESWHIIRELEDAKGHAWHTPIGQQGYLWTDLRERQMAEVKRVAYNSPDYKEMNEVLIQDMRIITMFARRRLDQQHADLVDDVVSDLFNCAFNRAVNGATGFFEQLFTAYRAGGWPCGWSGDFPNGHLAVYFPG
jgi:hypothetical protein